MSDSPAAPQPAADAPPDVPVWKLLTVLGGGGAVAGGVIVLAFASTQPRILEHRAKVLEDAVREVLGGPERFDTLYLVGDRLSAEAPAGTDASKLERIYLGHRADGSPAGFAITAKEPGFADDIRLIFGLDPDRGVLLGFRVLESKETPGLGDGIEKNEAYTSQFPGKKVPLVPVKKGASRGDAEHEVQTITGATISSATVVRIIDHAIERWTPQIDAWRKETAR